MSVILGISAHYHDAACCVIKDGVLVAAAQEERFSKVKHDPGIPVRAFRYCLKEAGASVNDITCIAYYEEPAKKVARQLWAGLPDILLNPLHRFRVDPHRAEDDIRECLGYDGAIEFVGHHLSHAASAYLFSGFAEAAILTVDGVGEWSTTTYGYGHGADIDLTEAVEFPNSLGLLYSSVTAYLGFEVNDAEYKVMGLAPYGKPKYADSMRKLIDMQEAGQYRLNMEYFDFLNSDRMYSDRFCELFGQPAREPESRLDQFHEDMASSIQVVLEEMLLEKANYLYERHPSDNLCMAGGVALNCVANGRIHREAPFENLFVQPAAGDSGGALGAAAMAHVRRTGVRHSYEPLTHVHLGPRYSNREVLQLLANSPLSETVHDFTCDQSALVAATAERLADGKVVGWFQGRMEFGARALGARSILADPRRPEMRDRINALVKMREAFRPFAPAVLESKMSEHFDLRQPSRFMLETCRVCSPLFLPAITHVDGSARVQTVNESSNARFHALLTEFDRLTGCPILLNTSFNLRGDPIVLDPVDAVWTFAISNIDTLVIEDYLVDRGTQPFAWAQFVAMAGARNSKTLAAKEFASVYTFL